MKHSHTSFVEEIEQHTTDTNEVAAPNDVQGKQTMSCTIHTPCLVMEHDSTPLKRSTVNVTTLSQRENDESKLNKTKSSDIP